MLPMADLDGDIGILHYLDHRDPDAPEHERDEELHRVMTAARRLQKGDRINYLTRVRRMNYKEYEQYCRMMGIPEEPSPCEGTYQQRLRTELGLLLDLRTMNAIAKLGGVITIAQLEGIPNNDFLTLSNGELSDLWEDRSEGNGEAAEKGNGQAARRNGKPASGNGHAVPGKK